ncbi:MAG: hypothetical protein LBJ73_04275, partial [Rickettsiales bacterium]|nr:hypothetical protein [Rickettsiales bacterium]
KSAMEFIEQTKGPAEQYSHSHQGHHIKSINKEKIIQINKGHLTDITKRLTLARKAKQGSEK